jgi:hypothetical protein
MAKRRNKDDVVLVLMTVRCTLSSLFCDATQTVSRRGHLSLERHMLLFAVLGPSKHMNLSVAFSRFVVKLA